MYYVYIVHTWEVHYSFVMKVCILPYQMVGVLYIYSGEILSVLEHMEDRFICTRYWDFFLKKQLSNLKVKI